MQRGTRVPLDPLKSETIFRKMLVNKRTKSIKIRLSEKELEQLNALKGRAELARWLREIGLEGGAGRHEVITHALPPEVVRLLAGIGGNLNQLAKHINGLAKNSTLDLRICSIELMIQLAATERALNAVRELIKNDC